MQILKRTSPPQPPNLAVAIADFRQRFTVPRKPAQMQLAEHSYRKARADLAALIEEQRVLVAQARSIPDGPGSKRDLLEQRAEALAPQVEEARTTRTEAKAALDAEVAKFQPTFLEALGHHSEEANRLISDTLRQVDEALAPLLDAEAFATMNRLVPNRVVRVAPLLAEKVREVRRLLVVGQ